MSGISKPSVIELVVSSTYLDCGKAYSIGIVEAPSRFQSFKAADEEIQSLFNEWRCETPAAIKPDGVFLELLITAGWVTVESDERWIWICQLGREP